MRDHILIKKCKKKNTKKTKQKKTKLKAKKTLKGNYESRGKVHRWKPITTITIELNRTDTGLLLMINAIYHVFFSPLLTYNKVCIIFLELKIYTYTILELIMFLFSLECFSIMIVFPHLPYVTTQTEIKENSFDLWLRCVMTAPISCRPCQQ